MNYHPENDMTEDEQAHWEAKAEEAGKGSGASACSRLPYPLRSAEELAGCLISHGLLDESAWHDPEGWDGGIEKRFVDDARRAGASRQNAGRQQGRAGGDRHASMRSPNGRIGRHRSSG